MRGRTLTQLLASLRSEIRVSQSAAHNAQAEQGQIEVLQRNQELLWEDIAWPHMKITRQYAGAIGQRYYDWTADFDIERIEKIEFKESGGWFPLCSGITASDFLAFDSDLDQRSWPARRWRLHEGDQIEVWPILDTAGDPTTFEGYFKVTGIKKLAPLVAPDDRADLDDRMIVLYSAAEVLGGRGAKDAQIKLDLANRRKAKIVGDLIKTNGFRMFGVGDRRGPRRSIITHYRPAGS